MGASIRIHQEASRFTTCIRVRTSSTRVYQIVYVYICYTLHMNEEIQEDNGVQKTNRTFKARKWVWPIVALALLGGGAFVWWWQQQNVSNLNHKINELNGKLQTLTAKEEPQTAATQVTSTYAAQVGKFTLSLDDYAIVVLHDGGAEGSPITQLLIADKTSEPGVVKRDLYNKAELTAIQYGLHNTTPA